LTRSLKTPIVAGDALVQAIQAGSSTLAAHLASHLLDQGEQTLRGRSGSVRVWTRRTCE
jgi:class 3 adenylate cyclase